MGASEKLIAIGVFLVIGLAASPFFFETVNAGTVKSGYLYGNHTTILNQGMHFPINPLATWVTIDTREKTLYLKADVIISGTGTEEDVVETHLIPNVKALLRQAGRSVEKAEYLFDDATVSAASQHMLEQLQPLMREKGFEVSAVLFRNIQPPAFINTAIQKKKEREQLAEQQKAELQRFETEQQQKVKQAQAELDASIKQADMIKALADARAYEITTINESLAGSTNFIKLESLKALQTMSANPANKLIILDGSSPAPIPFMNLADLAK